MMRMRTQAVAVLAQHQRIDVVINNAGVTGVSKLTQDGFVTDAQVNLLAPALLSSLLLSGGVSRIVNVASASGYGAVILAGRRYAPLNPSINEISSWIRNQ
jgi:NAD(P)-dependent dehydrogenase (short-subunit alcohol dehydrogenase family)